MKSKRNSSRQIAWIVAMVLWAMATKCPAVVFNFDDGTLQGWTISGIYAASNYTLYSPNPFAAAWDDALQYPQNAADPAGNNLGSASAWASAVNFPAGFPSGESYWYIDFISPDVTAQADWQSMTGAIVRITDNGTMPKVVGSAQILLNVTRKSDGTTTWLREVNEYGQGVFHDLKGTWMNLYPYFGDMSGYTVNNVRVRLFGKVAETSGKSCRVNIDNVAPTFGPPALGVQGTVTADSIGEPGNSLTFAFESGYGPAPQLTHATIDLSASNARIAHLGAFGISWLDPRVFAATLVNDQLLEIDFIGFDPGESILFLLNMDQKSTGTGTPLGSDYVGGTVELTFNGLSGKCTVPLTGSFQDRGLLSATADFSCQTTRMIYETIGYSYIHSVQDDLTQDWIIGAIKGDFCSGTCFVYKTSAGRLGKMRIDFYFRDPAIFHTLVLSWTTYDTDGSVYGSGGWLPIPNNWGCELDAGIGVVWPPDANTDWWWLVDDNLGAFALMPLGTASMKMVHHSHGLRSGDCNCDDRVNLADFAAVSGQWQQTGCGPPEWGRGTDFDNNGDVDWVDMRIIADHWLEGP